jgi:hypothetical protein
MLSVMQEGMMQGLLEVLKCSAIQRLGQRISVPVQFQDFHLLGSFFNFSQALFQELELEILQEDKGL